MKVTPAVVAPTASPAVAVAPRPVSRTVPVFPKDELSTGVGSARRRAALAVVNPGDVRQPARTTVAPPLDLAAAVAETKRNASLPVDQRLERLILTVSQLPQASRGELLRKNPEIVDSVVASLRDKGTGGTVGQLARLADALGPAEARALTDPLAKAIDAGALELKGGQAGRLDQNRHHRERQFVDSLSEQVDGGRGTLLRGALVTSLKAQGTERGDAFANALANGDAGLVKDGTAGAKLRRATGHALAQTDAVASAFAEATRTTGSAIEAAGGAIASVTDRIPGVEFLGPIGTFGNDLKGLGTAIKTAPDVVDAVKSAASYRSRIDALRPGESFSVGASADISFTRILGAEARGSLVVKRLPDEGGVPKYTVTASGSFGATAGVEVPNLDVKTKGSASVDVSKEFTFRSAADAKRGADVLLASAFTRATEAAAGSPGGLIPTPQGPLVRQAADLAAQQIFGATASDLRSLDASATAISFGGSLAGEFGAKIPGALSVDGKVEQRTGLRFELKDGHVTRAVLESKLTGGGGISTQAKGPAGKVTSGGKVQASVALEQGFTLPAGTTVIEALGATDAWRREPQVKATLIGTVGEAGDATKRGVSAGRGTTATLSLSVKVDPSALVASGALSRALEGDISGAIETVRELPANQGTTFSLAVTRSTTTKAKGNGSDGVGSVGVEATTTSAPVELLRLDSARADELLRRLGAARAQLLAAVPELEALLP